MKKDTYKIEKNIEKILRNSHTGFLNQTTCLNIKNKLKKTNYQELIPYIDAEKTILYNGTPPKIKLYKINCTNKLKHQSILGSLFALNITDEVFGDIVYYQNTFYIYTLETISQLIETNLTTIDKYKIKLEEVPLNTLNDYKRDYQEIELIVSSLRIDTIISRIIGTSRDNIQLLMKENSILLNYQSAKKKEQKLKENDIFSIKKYGKYRLKKIIGQTKKENYIILIEKYI